MNIEKINDSFNKLLLRWLTLTPLTKILLLASILVIPVFSILIMNRISSKEVVLYSAEQMKGMDLTKIKEILDSLNISYTVTDNNLILVPKEKEQYLRTQLSSYGLVKSNQEKGYELFDSTTWIKGEKELQVLELRALKGQLERDLTQFENIRNANVILDVPQTRSFSGNTIPAKASVILDLVPGARVTSSELRAITYHLSSAVRGLEPSRVAISDTTGKLYQGLDSEETGDSIRIAEIAAEDHIKAKIDGMLTAVIGANNFYTNVQASMNRDNIVEERKIYSGTVNGVSLGQPVLNSIKKSNNHQSTTLEELINSKVVPDSSNLTKVDEVQQVSVPVDYLKKSSTPGKLTSLSIGVVINEAIVRPEVYAYNNEILTGGYEQSKLKNDIENQLKTILKGYDVPVYQSVDFVPFYHPSPRGAAISTKSDTPATDSLNTYFLFGIGALLLGVVFIFIRSRAESNKPDLVSEVSHLKSTEDLEKILDKIGATSQRNSISEEIKKKNDLLIESMGHLDSKEFGEMLSHESPESVALLLCHLRETDALRIFMEMPLKYQKMIVVAFAEMDKVDPGSSLIKQSGALFGAETTSYLPSLLNKAIFLFNSMQDEEKKSVLSQLQISHPDFAKKINPKYYGKDDSVETHKGISV